MRRFASCLALVALLAGGGSGCSETVEGSCEDESCPEGHRCGSDDRCEPIATPTRIGDLGRFSALARRPNGALVAATYDATHGSLVLVEAGATGQAQSRVIDGWRVEAHTLADPDAGRWATLAIAPDETTHLAWYDADQGSLRYAAIPPGDGAWEARVVDGEGSADRGRHASLTLDTTGTPHVAYQDVTKRSLRYARALADGSWEPEDIPSCSTTDSGCPAPGGEDYGEYASVLVVAGQPRVVFYDRLRGDLKVAEREAGGGWAVTTLDGAHPQTGADTGDVGRFAHVALDQSRKLAVAYFDATRGALKYLRPSSSQLAPITVDNGAYLDAVSGARRDDVVGQHVALAFNDQGQAVMVYLDATRLRLKMARMSGGDSVLAVAELSGLGAGGHIALQSGVDGAIHGVYGEWLTDDAPRTRLRWFNLPGASSTGAPTAP